MSSFIIGNIRGKKSSKCLPKLGKVWGKCNNKTNLVNKSDLDGTITFLNKITFYIEWYKR